MRIILGYPKFNHRYVSARTIPENTRYLFISLNDENERRVCRLECISPVISTLHLEHANGIIPIVPNVDLGNDLLSEEIKKFAEDLIPGDDILAFINESGFIPIINLRTGYIFEKDIVKEFPVIPSRKHICIEIFENNTKANGCYVSYDSEEAITYFIMRNFSRYLSNSEKISYFGVKVIFKLCCEFHGIPPERSASMIDDIPYKRMEYKVSEFGTNKIHRLLSKRENKPISTSEIPLSKITKFKMKQSDYFDVYIDIFVGTPLPIGGNVYLNSQGKLTLMLLLDLEDSTGNPETDDKILLTVQKAYESIFPEVNLYVFFSDPKGGVC